MMRYFPLPLGHARWGLIGLLMLVAAGCGHPNRELIDSAPLISRTYRDGFGRKVVLRQPPQRIVSLSASITETIFAIGAEDRLVGVSHDSDHPDAANAKTAIVTHPDFDLPAVAALEPDLILASTEVHDQRIAPFFDRYGMQLYFENCTTLEEIFGSIKVLGQMLGRETAANKLSDSLAAVTKAIADSTAGQVKYNTVIVLGIDPITVVGPKGFMHDLLVKSGAKNAFAAADEKYPVVTAEQFIQAQPEYVIIPTTNDQAWAELVHRFPDIHNKIPATASKHIFQVEPDVIVRPGPRIVEGLEYITRVLHPRVSVD